MIRHLLMPVDDATRRQFLVTGSVLAALGAAACGDERRDAPDAATRTVDDAFGPVTVPVDPTRVIALYDDALDHALALGFPVVAGPGERGSAVNPFPTHLPVDTVDDVERIATLPPEEVDAEVIAGIGPDLILSDFVDDQAESVRTRLSPLAPVFSFDTYTDGWWAGFSAPAEAFGRTERLAEVRADLDGRAAAAREALAGWSGRTAVMGTAEPDGGMELHHADFEPFEGVLVADLGFEPAAVLAGLEPFATLSAERVGDVDADLAVLIQYGDNPIDELTASPLWRPETVVTVPSPQTYLGPYFYPALLDSLVEALS